MKINKKDAKSLIDALDIIRDLAQHGEMSDVLEGFIAASIDLTRRAAILNALAVMRLRILEENGWQ